QRHGDIGRHDAALQLPVDHNQRAVPIPCSKRAQLHFQESTYSGHSIAVACSDGVSASRVSIMTATSSAMPLRLLSAFFNAFGCGPCGMPLGCSVIMPG